MNSGRSAPTGQPSSRAPRRHAHHYGTIDQEHDQEQQWVDGDEGEEHQQQGGRGGEARRDERQALLPHRRRQHRGRAGRGMRKGGGGDEHQEDQEEGVYSSSGGLRVMSRLSSAVSMYYRYLNFTLREVRKRPLSYMIGVSSCFIVVWMSMVCISTLGQIDLIFLRLGENESGQYDLQVRPSGSVPGQTLNYRSVEAMLCNRTVAAMDFRGMSAPRIHVSAARSFATPHCLQEVFPEGFNASDVNADGALWKQWMYRGVTDREDGEGEEEEEEDTCAGEKTYCVPKYCSAKTLGGVEFMAMDTERERRMGLGRTWERPVPAPGHVYITRQMADAMHLSVGDTLIMAFDMGKLFVGPLREVGIVTDDTTDSSEFLFYVPFHVDSILHDPDGKFGYSTQQGVITDFESFYHHISKYLPPQYDTEEFVDSLSKVDAYAYAHRVYVNHPPDRLAVYNRNDFDEIQDSILKFSSSVMYLLGFNQLETEFPVMEYMRNTRFFSLFVGLIINIIVTILSVLSTVLIYSLLMINVENRTFELGVFRMLGMKRIGLIQLILFQSTTYSLPGWVFGVLAGQATYAIVGYALSWYLQLKLSWLVSLNSLLISSALGIVIPVLASIFPMKAALGVNLNDSLDTQHSKTKAVKFSIERASETKPSISSLVVGTFLALFGFSIYYFFPLAMLSSNATFLLYMFFGLLMAILLGMVLLSLNFESILETIVARTLFFWENQAVRSMVLKNLVAHRMRNRKTSIMQALALGFIIFIAVGFSINITNFQYGKMSLVGTRLNLNARNLNSFSGLESRAELEEFCRSEPSITGFAYVSYSIAEASRFDSTRITNAGMYKQGTVDVRAISPNMFRTTGDQFLVVSERRNFNALTLDEMLYHPSSTDKALIGTSFRESLGMWDMKKPAALVYQESTERNNRYSHRLIRPLAFLDKAPYAYFSKFLSQEQVKQVQNRSTRQQLLVSFPSFVRLSNGTFSSVEKVPIKTMLVSVAPSATDSEVYAMKNRLKPLLDSKWISIVDVQEELEPIQIAVTVMDIMFVFTTAVAMFLCFFSLMSSMYSNIHEQSKEIGILRAIGISKFSVTRIYIYEAFILVAVASFLGVVIGSVLSYTMSAQRALFTQLPMALVFPWQLCLMITGLSVVFAFLSSIFPISNLLRNSTVRILRKVT